MGHCLPDSQPQMGRHLLDSHSQIGWRLPNSHPQIGRRLPDRRWVSVFQILSRRWVAVFYSIFFFYSKIQNNRRLTSNTKRIHQDTEAARMCADEWSDQTGEQLFPTMLSLYQRVEESHVLRR